MATAFQESVWQTLTKIPKGRVTTYGAIAKAIGNPGAVRAVASAVGKNPNPPEVPCHRVIPGTGTLGKYSGPGGMATKKKLLAQEGVLFTDAGVLQSEDCFYGFPES